MLQLCKDLLKSEALKPWWLTIKTTQKGLIHLLMPLLLVVPVNVGLLKVGSSFTNPVGGITCLCAVCPGRLASQV